MIPWGMHADLEPHIMYVMSGFIYNALKTVSVSVISKHEPPTPDATFVDLPDPVCMYVYIYIYIYI